MMPGASARLSTSYPGTSRSSAGVELYLLCSAVVNIWPSAVFIPGHPQQEAARSKAG